MRILTIAALLLAITGCATAVYDSLDRRGVDARSILVERVADLRADAAAAKTALANAETALAGIDGADGVALSRKIDAARAAGQGAALAAQDLRLSAGSVKAASARYFGAREEELNLMKTSEEDVRAAETQLDASKDAYKKMLDAVDAANFRLSPALSLYDAEMTALKKSPTSGVAAVARESERAAARQAAREAAISLDAAVAGADRFAQSLK